MSDFAGEVQRIARYGSRNATALAAANFALSAGFGTTATVSAVVTGSTDMAGEITITSAGTGQGASPTCTLTFADGAFRGIDGTALAPLALVQRNGGSQTTVDFTWTTTSTTLVLTLAGTPVAAQTFTLAWRLSA
jgi:hypothetical protein